ncbi:MAG: hypothetical protein WA919_16880 [Coleofasciculaceae cyanobacterium]
MEEQLKNLVLQVQLHPQESEERHKALKELVEHILRSRKICRPCRWKSLSGVYLDIFQTLQQQLQWELDQRIDKYKPQVSSIRSWTAQLRDRICQYILDEEHLQQLAVEVQCHQANTKEWRYAVKELLTAICLSGKLSHLHQNQFSPDIYEDAVNRTLLFVCKNINYYDPTRGKFMAWVNYRLNMMLKEAHKEYKEPLIQAINGRIIRVKYKLNHLTQTTKQEDIKFWLQLHIKNLIPDEYLANQVEAILTVLVCLSQLKSRKPLVVDSLLFEIAKNSIPLSPSLCEMKGETMTIENMAQPFAEPCLSDKIRQYLEEDPDKLFQKHIRNHPEATFQTIALGRLEGKTWKEMSESFQVAIPALSNFFQRRLKELAPEIRKYVQE